MARSGISRRKWLTGAAGLLPGNLRGEQPEVTAADQFFVRDHFAAPDLSLATWTLRVEGRVTHPLEITFSDLLESDAVEQPAVLECAGNGEAGAAVGMGIWRGIPIATLLKMAGAEAAGDVLLEGADRGRLMPGAPEAPYARLVPGRKCRAPESLIAFQLNGRFLARRNGFPARAILPGWYGMDSVKWLRRMVVLAPGEKPAGYAQNGMTRLYMRERRNQASQRITAVQVKSLIQYPPDRARLPAAVHPVSGYAWTGAGVVSRVEVSTDGGKSWEAAKLESAAKPYAWVPWSYRWRAATGDHVLLSRAEDSVGNRQPLVRDPERLDGYELSWCAPVRCTVG